MHIFITGGLGFVGRHMSRLFLDRGFEVTAVGRSTNPEMIHHPNFSYIAADLQQEGKWQDIAAQADVVVNLAGKSIFSYWTEKRKKEIYDSRILTTRNLVNALCGGQGKLLCSTSAVGYYGDKGEETLTEDHGPGNDFLARVAMDWEKEALAVADRNLRVVIMRFGIVLAEGGGAMAKMIPAFRMFLGGPLGNGRQWFPWIHMKDLIQAALFSINTETLQGPVNLCAPEAIRQVELAKILARKLHRPAILPAPAFVIKLFMGEFGDMLLNSMKAVPQRLNEHGFQFRYPSLDSALDEIVTS